jgi:nitrile hydratase accessory protein
MTEELFKLDGNTTPPTANGEIIFDAPWQSRVFGMAHSLCQSGHYEWDEFRTYLIEDIENWEQQHFGEQRGHYPYFDLFLESLTRLLNDKAIVPRSEVQSRAKAFSDRPHGHDHAHHHNEGHSH